MTTITATYSPEDNKLRLYASARLDADTYQQLRAAGFKWAPKQELFVAPAWTPAREDLCIALAGEIDAEGTSLADRAAAKLERLQGLQEKRAAQSDAFHKAAARIGERFAMGQPILIGHHSERGARRDQARMHAAMDASVKARKAVDYWQYRARGVAAHANRKTAADTTARRIKKLLAELRDIQRGINHSYAARDVWLKVQADQADMPPADYRTLVARLTESRLPGGALAPSGTEYKGSFWYRLTHEDAVPITPEAVVKLCIMHHERGASSAHRARWMSHLLHRLAYERAQLGPVARFDEDLTPVILQAFAREHGTEKPKATATAAGFRLESPVPLPAHIGDGCALELDPDGWRDLMQACGHVPAAPAQAEKRAAKAPLLNIRGKYVGAQPYGRVIWYGAVEMTRAEYAAINKDYRGVRHSGDGLFRFRTAMSRDPATRGHLVRVFLVDQKEHDAPASPFVRDEPPTDGEKVAA